jgi:hypothetical protein
MAPDANFPQCYVSVAHDWKFDDGTTNSFMNSKWNPGEPNGWRGRREPCVQVWGGPQTLNDIACHQ